jgi:hypothetical protein
MTFVSQNGDQLMRYGHPLHKINPSVLMIHMAEEDLPESDSANGAGSSRLDQQFKHERFLKFYLEGIRQYSKLNKAGTDLFEFVYEELSDSTNQGKDQLCVNYVLANQWNPDLTRRTYSRGIAELLDKNFLYRSMVNDIYFVNINFIFNGDRSTLARSYLSSTVNLQMLKIESIA